MRAPSSTPKRSGESPTSALRHAPPIGSHVSGRASSPPVVTRTLMPSSPLPLTLHSRCPGARWTSMFAARCTPGNQRPPAPLANSESVKRIGTYTPTVVLPIGSAHSAEIRWATACSRMPTAAGSPAGRRCVMSSKQQPTTVPSSVTWGRRPAGSRAAASSGSTVALTSSRVRIVPRTARLPAALLADMLMFNTLSSTSVLDATR